MFFTIEPMINLGRPHVKVLADGWTAVTRDRSLSAQFEHSIGITETGCEIFTLRQRGSTSRPIRRKPADAVRRLLRENIAHGEIAKSGNPVILQTGRVRRRQTLCRLRSAPAGCVQSPMVEKNRERAKGLAEAPPHYFGHRERLRDRFREAGTDALSDYELLELAAVSRPAAA